MATIRIECEGSYVELAVAPADVYRAEDRKAWIDRVSGAAFGRLFGPTQLGWEEKQSDAMFRLVAENPDAPDREKVEQFANALREKGL